MRKQAGLPNAWHPVNLAKSVELSIERDRCDGMELLISLIIVLAIISIAYWAITQIPLPQPVRIAAVVICALIAIVVLLNFLPATHGLLLR